MSQGSLYTTSRCAQIQLHGSLNTTLLLGEVIPTSIEPYSSVGRVPCIEGIRLTVPDHVAEDVVDLIEGIDLDCLMCLGACVYPWAASLLSLSQDVAEGLVDELLLVVWAHGESVMGAASLVNATGPRPGPVTVGAVDLGVAEVVAMPAS